MTKLVTLLESLYEQSGEHLKPEFEEAMIEARDLSAANETLHAEIKRFEQILRDIRQRDARKNCLCRGMG